MELSSIYNKLVQGPSWISKQIEQATQIAQASTMCAGVAVDQTATAVVKSAWNFTQMHPIASGLIGSRCPRSLLGKFLLMGALYKGVSSIPSVNETFANSTAVVASNADLLSSRVVTVNS